MAGVLGAWDAAREGAAMHAWVRAWHPWARSITGAGLRQTLRAIGEQVPLTQHEVPSGTPVLDWTVPREWTVREAYIADADGRRVVDFGAHCLHLMGYSAPVRARLRKAELAEHIFTLPDHPDWIPYRTSYYSARWAFCMRHRDWEALPEGEYEVVIDTGLHDGAMSYAECLLAGERSDEVLISAHACHPGLANDNLSGIVVALRLAQILAEQPRRNTYRFLFAPGTIGAIAWLAQHETVVPRVRHGLVLACVGDAAPPSYKRSRREVADIDRAAARVLGGRGHADRIVPFAPYGYDERQYGSPGFNLPVGCFMRSGPAGYPEYHSSADDPTLVRPEALADSLACLLEMVEILEGNGRYVNLQPHGEPQLGRRGLYGAIGGHSDAQGFQMALLWVLNFSDGAHDLLAIAERAGMPFRMVREAADALLAADLIAPASAEA
jgi:aminopeptidase-like protein